MFYATDGRAAHDGLRQEAASSASSMKISSSESGARRVRSLA